tara:strand:- start:386 stop:943 length:558 start_codon:yes stop_codon:yes gene_type:complete
MNHYETRLSGLICLEPPIFGDDRGFFTESYHQEKWAKEGVSCSFVQDNFSVSQKGILRGLHLQRDPKAQAKLLRVTLGSILDVAVDLRPNSSTFCQWEAVELSDKNHRQLFVPTGFAHGFLVLSDVAHVHYKCSEFYSPEHEVSIQWNDSDLGIQWFSEDPISPSLSEKDQNGLSLKTYLSQIET